MARLNRVTALLVGLALLPRSASAVTISFAEPVAETDPVHGVFSSANYRAVFRSVAA